MVDDNEGSRAGRGRTDLPKTEPSKAEAMSFDIVHKVVSEVFEERADENSGSRPGRGRANLPMIQPNEARLMFFETVRELKPKVFEELAGDPLDVFNQMSARERDTVRTSLVVDRFVCRKNLSPQNVMDPLERELVAFAVEHPFGFTLSTIDEHFASKCVNLRETIAHLIAEEIFEQVGFMPCWLEWETDIQESLYRQIILWMRQWNVDAPWCFSFAIDTLAHWRREPAAIKDYSITTHFEDETPLFESRFKIDFTDLFDDKWWLGEESKSEARTRIRKKALLHINEKLGEIERLTANWLPRTEDTRRNIAVFAMYQILKYNQTQIEKHIPVKRARVSQIIGRISHVIGLTPRPPNRPGRPETPRTGPSRGVR